MKVAKAAAATASTSPDMSISTAPSSTTSARSSTHGTPTMSEKMKAAKNSPQRSA
eukprot:CAMPEP_0183352854 /NCGR_PEP_ID=MMETSP0164_2-20130417/31028_1 /TAXON_ID=221442 /ORGANISM="Coccolithus pelagicus ssp braarudi, Strain PLY182g" /LENGTH=54 /DNA_ID=CAMNT_0025525403 /DNA_START=506 /DNA_END=670 /DNA_ORIENTATION=-